MNKYIEIVNIDTLKVIKRFDVTNKGERIIDKIENGININLNHDEFYTNFKTTNKKLKI